jgi:hypothetical protein
MKKLSILLLAFIVISLILAASCVTRQVPVVETYYETEYKTEYRTEPYTETVNTVISSKRGTSYLNPQVKWYTDVLIPGFGGLGGTYYYDYVISSSHTKNQIEIDLSTNTQLENGTVRVYDLSRTGPIPPRPTPFKRYFYTPSEITWLENLNAVIGSAPLLGQAVFGPGAPGKIVFDANNITEFGIFATTWDFYSIRSVKLNWTDEVTGQKNVTGERQVPYQVPTQVEKQRTVYKTETVPFWDALFGK